MQDNYIKSYAYENYITSARLCRTDEFGAHYSYMKNLMDSEQNDPSASMLMRSKLLADVKKLMVSATRAALRRELSEEDKVKLRNYLRLIESSETSVELLSICNKGLELLQKYRPV